jgi:hypothetical protein
VEPSEIIANPLPSRGGKGVALKHPSSTITIILTSDNTGETITPHPLRGSYPTIAIQANLPLPPGYPTVYPLPHVLIPLYYAL